MRCFTITVVLLSVIANQCWSLPAAGVGGSSNSLACSSSGGNEDGEGVSVTCTGDANTKGGPFPNLANEIGDLSVFSVNASDEVPVQPAVVESLSLETSSNVIPDNAFGAFRSLKHLTIDCSRSADANGVGPAVDIKPGAFKGLESTLKRLVLIGMNLAAAGGLPAPIRSLTALEVLHLEDCDLKGELKGQDLQQCKNLREFVITSRSQIVVADNVFSNNAATLEKVMLDKVQMKAIPQSVSSCKSLQYFEIRRSGVTAVPAGVFQNSAAQLKELRLSDNAISSIDPGAFKGLSALNVLVLSGNKISSIPPGLFDDLVACDSLQLDGNQLTSASVKTAFGKMSKLKQVSLGNNNLDAITPELLSGIENSATLLYFAGNQIKSVQGIGKLTQKPQLILSSNNIDSLAKDSLESSTFSELDLDSNPITKIQSGAFNGVSVGPNFAVADTALTEFDLSSLAGMKECQNLTISDNENLKAITVSSDSAVPSTLKYIICQNNPRLVLTDANGKLAAYLKKSMVTLIFKDRILCKCELGWLKKGNKNVVFASADESGQVALTQCCNIDNTAVDQYLADSTYSKQCPAGAAPAKANTNDEEHC